MLIVILILNLINFIGLLIAAIIYFKKNYVIYSKEVADEMTNYYLQYHDDQGNELAHELAGGVGVDTGFFREALYEEEEQEDE